MRLRGRRIGRGSKQRLPPRGHLVARREGRGWAAEPRGWPRQGGVVSGARRTLVNGTTKRRHKPLAADILLAPLFPSYETTIDQKQNIDVLPAPRIKAETTREQRKSIIVTAL